MSFEVFDRLWWRYDEWYEKHPVTARNELLAVLEALRGAPGPCMEVGVGTGWFAARAGCRYGVDPSRGMLRVALMRGVEVVQGRGESLPVRSGSLGSVLLVVTLCFVDDPHVVLAEAARSLAPGGVLAACIVPRDSPWGLHYESLARMGHPFYSRARFLSSRELVEAAVRAGFAVERLIGTLTYGPLEAERSEEPREYRPGMGFLCLRGRAVTGLERAEGPGRAR